MAVAPLKQCKASLKTQTPAMLIIETGSSQQRPISCSVVLWSIPESNPRCQNRSGITRRFGHLLFFTAELATRGTGELAR